MARDAARIFACTRSCWSSTAISIGTHGCKNLPPSDVHANGENEEEEEEEEKEKDQEKEEQWDEEEDAERQEEEKVQSSATDHASGNSSLV